MNKIKLLFILCFLLVGISNSSLSAQSNQITLNLPNATIEQVLNGIEAKTSYRFLYNKEIVNVNKRINAVFTNKSVSDILNEIFKNTGITQNVIGDQIVLTKKDSEPNSGNKISGTVLDNKGEPVIGATVKVKGASTGTITNYNGEYSLEVPANSTLSVSYIGYKSTEINIGSKKNVDFNLQEDVKSLNEVVVTALGIKREQKALGYAVQQVEGDVIQTVKGIDIGTSLTGKVAGLIVKNSTEFGAEANISFRGAGNPILVVDGVQFKNMTLRDIPADDIESMSFLKGGTASALYGELGDNGAIMITTKKGKKGKGVSVSFNSSSMFSAGYLAIPELQSTYGRVVNTSTNTYVRSGDGSWGAPMEGQDVIQWDPISKTMKSMPYLPVGANNFQNFLEQGYILNNNVNITQQGENGNLRASATWVDNKGQYPNSKFDKITYSIGGEMKMDKFTLLSSLTYNKNTSPNLGFNGYTGYDPMYSMLIWSAADWNVLDYKDYWLIPNEVQNSSYTAGNNNPYFDRYERTHSLNKDILNGVLELNYDILPWLKAKARSGYDTYSNRQEIRVSKGSFQGAGNGTIIPNGTEVWGESQKGSYNLGISRGYSLNNEAFLLGNNKVLDFNIESMFGASSKYSQDEGLESRTRGGLSIPAFYSLKASIDPVITESKIYRRQTNSLFGRLAVDWKSIVFAEATFRNDWVSTLSPTQRSYFYPSLSGSFVISELLPKQDWLSFWKLRSSWVSSKKTSGIYDINTVYSITQAAWGTLNSATYPTTVRNQDIFPESTSTYEVGSAISLFQNRVALDVAYYAKDLKDFIKSAATSSASGFSNNYINLDEQRRRSGIEVALNVTPVKTKDWKLGLDLNWTTFKTVYTKLDSLYSGDRPWIKVGERTDYYIYRDYLKDPQGNIVHNASGLPLFSSYDSNAGYSDPKFVWGIGANLSYKNIDLSISADGRVGGLAQTITEMYMWRSGSHPNSVVPERYLDATVAGSKNYLGTGVKVVSGTATYDTYGNILTDTRVFAPNDVKTTYKSYIETYHKGTAWGGSPSPVDLYDATFFKIREIALTYRVPKKYSKAILANNVSVSAIAQNVFLWAKQFKYSDIDGGSENFNDPSERYVGFNVKVEF